MHSGIIFAYREHPFDFKRVVVPLPDGLTIQECVERLELTPSLQQCLVVRLQGHVIIRGTWHRVRPRSGTFLEAVPLPAGGETMRTVLMIAIVAAAMAAGGWIAMGPLGLAAGGMGFAFASSAIGGALTMGGMLALNALIPPPQEQMKERSDSSPTYGIEGASNSARLNAPIPMVLGVHRIVPDLAAPWVTLLDGDDEYLYGLLSWGFGPATVTEIRIGDTPIENFRGVQMEHYAGDAPGNPSFTLYPNSVTTTSVGTLLKSGVREIRNADDETERVTLEFQFRSGAIKYSSRTGDELGVTVNLRIRYRAVGTEPWSAEISTDVFGKQASPKRTTRAIQFPSRGQWEIEVRRTTGDSSDSNVADEVHWENIKSINNDAPIADMHGVVLTALKIQASEQLNGIIRDLSGVVTSYGPQWNGAAWTYGPINNPASLFRRFLQGKNMRSPVPDSRIDLPQLQYWAQQSAARLQTCNFVVDREMSVWEVLTIIAGTADATPTRMGGKWGVIIDEAKPFPVALLNERNVNGFKGRRIFVEEPHALRAKFPDETDDYRQQTRLIYNDGYDVNNATEFEDTEFPGVTNPDQIWRMGRRRLAEGRLRAQTFTWEMDFEHLVITRGDLVAVQHGAALWGRSGGRILRVLLDGGNLIGFDLDEAVVFDAAGDFVMRIRRSDNTQAIFDITEPVGETERVFLAQPVPYAGVNIFAGDLYVIGVRDREVRQLIVRSIEPTSDLKARITAIPYAPGVFTAHLGPIPEWNPLTTPRPGRIAPIIRAVVSGDAASVRNPDGSLTIRVIAMLFDDGTRQLSRLRGIEVAWKRLDDTSPFTIIPAPPDAVEVAILGAPIGVTLRITARYVLLSGGYGPWGFEVHHQVVGPRIPPLDVTGLILEGLSVRWNYNPGPDHGGFRVRFGISTGTAWEEAEDVTDALVTERSIQTAELPIGTRLVLVKAVTRNGVESAQAATLQVEITEAQQRIPLGIYDFRGAGWPGSLTGGERVGGEIRALDTSLWLDNAGAPWLTPEGDSWIAGTWSDLVYIANVRTPVDLVASDRMYLRSEIDGAALVAYRWGTADLTYHPFDAPIADDLLAGDMSLPIGTTAVAEQLRVWRAWRQGISAIPGQPLQIRVTIPSGGPLPPAIRQLAISFDGEEIREIFSSLAVPAAGIALPVVKRYRVLGYIIGSIHAGGSAIAVAIDSRSTTAPRIHLEDAAKRPVDGTADVTVGGS